MLAIINSKSGNEIVTVLAISIGGQRDIVHHAFRICHNTFHIIGGYNKSNEIIEKLSRLFLNFK